MKTKSLMMGAAILAFVLLSSNAPAQDTTHEAVMSMLGAFLADPAARADHASKNPGALQAEQNLSQFPPNIQKRLEKVVLMILQESGANASRHVDAAQISGPEGALNSFSPAVRKEIQEIGKELEKDPEFMKKAGSLR
jgi:hypothetical protein